MTDEELKEKVKNCHLYSKLSPLKKQRIVRIFGGISMAFYIICFAVLWFVYGFNTIEKAVYFQTGWFAFGIISQTMIIYVMDIFNNFIICSNYSNL